MSVSIITGYTGERHITPYMDAAVNRSIFGEDGCILATGNQMSASMPTINSFVIADGAFSIQGHIGVTNGETLAVDTCATGSNRIDLVVARFTHNATTLIDGLEIVLVKGEETTSAYPTTPTINTGVIANGATTVDLALYKITLSGSDVSFQQLVRVHASDLWNYSRTNDLVAVVGETADTGFDAERTDTGVGAFFGVGAGGVNHGVWSRTNNHWMIYENAQGVCGIQASDVRIGGHSSGIGTYKNAWLSSNKTCASGTWYGLCNIQLEAGVWLIIAGARWNANTSGNRQANVSPTSGDTSQNISMAPATNSVTSARFCALVNPSSTTRYYLNVYQNSGSSIVCPTSGNGYGNHLRAVRIL